MPPSPPATELPSPPTGSVVKFIAMGHGIQNYTCANASATAAQLGALAVLYDITPYYPGTPSTGLTEDAFEALSASVMFSQDLPLNLVDTTAASPGTTDAPNALPESAYMSDTSDPFPAAPSDLSLGASMTASFLGHHYFDGLSAPTFDLSSTAGLRFSGAKAAGVKAPAGSNTGIISSGAVDWLQLADNGRGLGVGVSYVYRVVTAGGAAEACSVSGAGVGSVPYTAQYWFFD